MLRRNLFVSALALFVWAGSLAAFAPAGASAAAPQRNAAKPRPAQQKPAPAPTPAQPSGPLAEAAPFVNRVLANGLEVIVLEDHSVPLVTVELAVRNGSFTETPELNGLSHLYEHMFFKVAPEQAIRSEYLRGIDSLGIVYNGETHEEVVNYYFTTTTPNFPVALRFMRDQAVYQTFNEQQFGQEREVVVGELDRHESNPYGAIGEETNR
ncbi:MAG TPA: insulinase family protein, partial [Pyrinomonadaceae bacterium]|nr:insulinase family protein [Pyrinomonadaceae bacterium]